MNLLPRRKPARTFRQTLTRALRLAVINSVLVGAPLAVVAALPVNMTWAAPEHGATASADLPAAKGSQADVIKRAGCKVAPEGVFPTSVVADPAGERSWTHITSQRGLGHAFEQLVFDGVLEANEWTQPVDHGMRVGVFCR